MVVVATALVNGGEVEESCGAFHRNGELCFVCKWPKDFRATSFSPCVTATEAAGKARSAIACSRTEKAEEKSSS